MRLFKINRHNQRKKVCAFLILLLCASAATMPGTAYGAGNAAAVTGETVNIQDNSATLNGHITPDYPDILVRVRFLYSTRPNDANPVSVSFENPAGSAFSHNVTSLSPNTTYYVRMTAEFMNSVTSRTYISTGSELSFHTTGTSVSVPSAPSGSTLTVAAPSMSSQSASSVYLQSVYAVTGRSVSRAGFVYSASVSNPTLEDSKNASSPYSALSAVFSETVTDLEPGQTVFIRAFVSYVDAYGVPQTIYSSAASYVRSSSTTPLVETTAAEYRDGYLEVRGIVVNSGGSAVYENGFVYSSVNPSPVIGAQGDTKYVANTQSSATKTEFGGAIYASQNFSMYYVRAYAVNHSGIAYGKVYNVPVGVALPSIEAQSVTDITPSSANVTVSLIRSGESTVTERGVVLSETDPTPERGKDGAKTFTAAGTTGAVTIAITGLEQNTTYYIRAFATNSTGTAYSETKELTTSRNTVVTTSTPETVTQKTALAHAEIPADNGFVILERGFLYLEGDRTPLYDTGLKISDDINGTGSYTMELSGLRANTVYGLRAFVRTSQGVSYGNTVLFTTSNEYAPLTVLYQTEDGNSISSETIDGGNLTEITASHLKIPAGYQLADPDFRLAYHGETSAIVRLRRDISTERPYMAGTSASLFSPDIPIKRVEVAEMIYRLYGGQAIPAQTAYHDVPDGYYAGKAIQFVSSMQYMQGYEGYFRPEDTITRAEFSVVLCRVLNLQGTGAGNKFSDVAGHWGYTYIYTAAENGIINGYNGLFRPDDTATRAESCVMFSLALQRSLLPMGTAEFIDVPSSHYAYRYIMNAAVPGE